MTPQNAAVGLSFTETMKGFLQKGVAAPAQEDIAAYVAAERAGQQSNTYMEFTLTITAPNLDQFLASAEHAAIANGSVRVDGFTGSDGAPVSNGVFNLFVETGRMYDRRMLYAQCLLIDCQCPLTQRQRSIVVAHYIVQASESP